MPNILVRAVAEGTLDALKQRARQNRRSLQQELLTILEMAAGGAAVPNPAQNAAAIRARLSQGSREFSDSVEQVREDRER